MKHETFLSYILDKKGKPINFLSLMCQCTSPFGTSPWHLCTSIASLFIWWSCPKVYHTEHFNVSRFCYHFFRVCMWISISFSCLFCQFHVWSGKSDSLKRISLCHLLCKVLFFGVCQLFSFSIRFQFLESMCLMILLLNLWSTISVGPSQSIYFSLLSVFGQYIHWLNYSFRWFFP